MTKKKEGPECDDFAVDVHLLGNVASCETEVADLDDAVREDQDVARPDLRLGLRVEG